MSQIIMPKDQGLQVADVFREHIADYQKAYTLAPDQKKIVTDILNCSAHLSWMPPAMWMYPA